MLSHRPAIDPPAALSQLVLDALPESVLLLNPATGTLQPANLAGAQLVALVPGNSEGTQFGELFPELNLAMLPIAEGGVVLARMNHAVADTTGEVLLRLLPLGNSDRASTPRRVAIFVRSVASVAECTTVCRATPSTIRSTIPSPGCQTGDYFTADWNARSNGRPMRIMVLPCCLLTWMGSKP